MSVYESVEELAVLSLRPDVVATVLNDGAVLLDLETKYFYAINQHAWALVQMFESGASISEVERQGLAWGAPSDGSVRAFIEALQSYELLEASDAAATSLPVTVDAPPSPWKTPTLERQPEPLQQVIVSAFDPSIPLAE